MISSSTVVFELPRSKKKKKKKRKKRKTTTENQQDEEAQQVQLQFVEELAKAGCADLFPTSFGKKKTEKTHIKYDSDGGEKEKKTTTMAEVCVVENNTQTKKRKRSDPNTGSITPSKATNELNKYWHQRYSLFTLFDNGIQMDHEGWFSVTPEVISKHIAERCRCDVIVDPFAGCGGNVIQFAFTCNHVIAIDINPKKIAMAKHNARIYGVEDRIEWIVGDAIQILPTIKADVIFLSPPWGGPNYIENDNFEIDQMVIEPVKGSDLFNIAKNVSPNIAYFLPRNVPMEEVEKLAPLENCEYEKNCIGSKLKTITAYFGDLVSVEINSE